MMDDNNLTEQELSYIDVIVKWIKEQGKLDNDNLMLLRDWISALKANLFFSAASVFLVHLEKHLRTTLVMILMKKKDQPLERFMNILEETEEQIENETDGKKYRFNNLCKELFNLWYIGEQTKNKLLHMYEHFRNPVQHWIYWRLMKYNYWNVQIPMVAGDLWENATAEDLKNMLEAIVTAIPNSTSWIHNPIIRIFKLPQLMKDISFDLLTLTKEVIEEINIKL